MSLFNYAFAKQQGGTFILRIEDTDRTRFRADSERQIFDALRWLGLDWDEGPDIGGPHAPYRQSERTAIYREHAQILLAGGAAYRCFCADTSHLAVDDDDDTDTDHRGYDRTCRGIDPAEAAARAQTETFVVRLAMPTDRAVSFVDRFRGTITFPADQCDDQVLLKSDGFPTYHLASVVDDHLMAISHVVRGEEWMSSTPHHVTLYAAFGWQPPEFLHMPLLRNNDATKTKISKRRSPVSINYFRESGILPEALRNYLGTLGWSFGGDREKFTLEEMIEVFSWDRISVGGPVFDLVKLKSLNKKYIMEMPHAELARRIVAWRFNERYVTSLMPLAQTRIATFSDLVPLLDYCFADDLDLSAVLPKMTVDGTDARGVANAIRDFVERFEVLDEWTATALGIVLKAWLAAHAWKGKQGIPLLKYALVARENMPDFGDTMEVLGKEICRRRLRRAADALDPPELVTR